MHASPVLFRIVALNLLMENMRNGEGGGLSTPRGWPEAPNSAPQPGTSKLSCLGSGYQLRPKLKAQESGRPPLMKHFPF